MKMKSRTRKTRHLNLESLEGRKLMAGDVSVALEGQLLTVQGDNLGNQVVVSQNAAGTVTVSGQNGTLINGLASVRFVNPQLNAMEIRMEDGDDSVSLRGVRLANDLFADLGNGNDLLSTSAATPVVVGGNAMIEAGAGNDAVRLNGITVREDLMIQGGLGTLNTSLNAAAVDKALTIIGDDANDSVALTGVQVGGFVSIETKGGSDIVSMNDVSAFAVLVNTDANGVGVDRVTMNRVTAVEDIGISTGAGNDTVAMTDVTSGKSLTVSLDEGNDSFTGTRVSVAEDAVFEGGAGVDVFTDGGITAGIKKDVKEFETRR
jgi:hypothetical protein